jgi:hypothetical protein
MDKISENIRDHSTMNMKDIQREYNTARKTLREAQRNSIDLRIKWLEGKQRLFKMLQATKEEKEIQVMIAKLHSKRLNKKLSRITKGKRGSLDHIEIPTGVWYYSKAEK